MNIYGDSLVFIKEYVFLKDNRCIRVLAVLFVCFSVYRELGFGRIPHGVSVGSVRSEGIVRSEGSCVRTYMIMGIYKVIFLKNIAKKCKNCEVDVR
jgi:hypothetical protein